MTIRPDRFLWRWRERILAVGLVIAGVAGFVTVRHAADGAANRQAKQRAELIGLQVQSSVARAAAYVDALRGYLVGHRIVGEADFSSFTLGILGFAGLNEAAWVEPISRAARERYESSLGRPIAEPRGLALARAPIRPRYYPATLITEVLTDDLPGVDLGTLPALRGVLESSEPLFSVVSTAPLERAGGSGLFFVEAARRGNVPGFVVVFVPVDWLEGSLANSPSGVEIRVAGGSIGHVRARGALTQSFTAAAQRWRVLVPQGTVSVAASALAWSLLAAGLALAALTLLVGAQRRRAEQERQTQLWFLESLDRINRAIQSGSDVEQMYGTVLDVVRAIFGCDRGWLVRSGDSGAGPRRIVSERTRPGHPGAFSLNAEIANDAEVADAFRSVRSASGPVRFDPHSDQGVPSELDRRFGTKSMIVTAVRPKMGETYVLGLDQCSYVRIWTRPEERLFQEIGWRLADGLESGLMLSKLVDSREALRQLAGEQAALRRVATLVAQAAPAAAVFGAVAAEMETLLGADGLVLGRYEAGNELTIVAQRGPRASLLPPGTRLSHEGRNVTSIVRHSERPARLEHYEGTEGKIAEVVREMGVRATVGAPIVVDGRLWGLAIANWGDPSPPANTEHRLGQFAQLLATAIANAESRDQLNASRARLLTAADEARRRVVRDLHDGAQQRLVQTIVTLKLAQRALQTDAGDAEALVGAALELADRGHSELRELAHGILPAALTQGGLRAGIQTVVARLDLPVEVDIVAERLPAEIEANAYFIVAEALTNVVKHARAVSAQVKTTADDGTLHIQIRDDGVGGADPTGHGLVGLGDRVAALGGRLDVASSAGGGTLVSATLPLHGR